jgi:hypothetical protein
MALTKEAPVLGFFGQYLVENGVIDYLQLDLGLSLMTQRNKRLGDLAVADGLLRTEDANALQLKQRTVDKYFGELAVEQGFFSLSDVQMLLDLQRKNHLRIGEALVGLGVVSREAVEQAFGSFAAEQAAVTSGVSLLPAGTFEPVAAHLKKNLPRRIQRVFGEPAKLGGIEPHKPLPRFEIQATALGGGEFSFALDAQRRWLRGMHRSKVRDSEIFASDETMREVAGELLFLVASATASLEGVAFDQHSFGEPRWGELPMFGTAMSLVTPHGRAILVLSTAR